MRPIFFPKWWRVGVTTLLGLLASRSLSGGPADPFSDLDTRPRTGVSTDSIAPTRSLDQTVPVSPERDPGESKSSIHPDTNSNVTPRWLKSLLTDGFTFKRELLFEYAYSLKAEDWYSRNSVGGEVLKKFSTDTATVAAFNVQLRLVRRDNFHEVLNDVEGHHRPGWFFEYHNLYWDFYNILNPVLPDNALGEQAGRFNLRLGRFYVPFGLNLQTDTHGTLLQLSNERNFGFERDWYTGLWGSVNRHFNYDCYYLMGSGYDVAYRGQSGLLGTRLSLGNHFLNDYGFEGGLSWLSGQRLSKEAVARSRSVALESPGHSVVNTLRGGADVRWRHPVPSGSLTLSAEVSGGRDESDPILTELYQAEYLTLNRRFGASLQYRQFDQSLLPAHHHPAARAAAVNRKWDSDGSVVVEFTWYLRNDPSNAQLHWIKFNVERKTQTIMTPTDTLVTVQYYRYW